MCEIVTIWNQVPELVSVSQDLPVLPVNQTLQSWILYSLRYNIFV